jgi:mannose-1-phosphate guanylyltransferase
MGKPLADLDVAVLAGGLGTRLAGAVPGLPKILAPVAGRPFAEHLLDWLAREGARRIVFLLGHRADAVRAHLAAHPRAGLVFEALVEPSPLGTGGALAFARARLGTDPVLTVNGDTFVDSDLSPLRTAHETARAAAAMLCVRVPDAGRYGRIEIADGRVAKFAEKDPSFRGEDPSTRASICSRRGCSTRSRAGGPSRSNATYSKNCRPARSRRMSTRPRASWTSARPKAGATRAPS